MASHRNWTLCFVGDVNEAAIETRRTNPVKKRDVKKTSPQMRRATACRALGVVDSGRYSNTLKCLQECRFSSSVNLGNLKFLRLLLMRIARSLPFENLILAVNFPFGHSSIKRLLLESRVQQATYSYEATRRCADDGAGLVHHWSTPEKSTRTRPQQSPMSPSGSPH